MRLHSAHSAQARAAQALTCELLTRAGIRPGMRVVDVGTGCGDVAFLVAERVGTTGHVLGIDEDAGAIARARQLGEEAFFEQVAFRAERLEECDLREPFDAVIGRFMLFRRSDPVAAIRKAARLVRPGGRVIFQEWHYESLAWTHTTATVRSPLYRFFVESALRGLRREGAHIDMGLRLPNAFVEAGLPVPATQLSLQTLDGTMSWGFHFFEEVLAELASVLEGEPGCGSAELATFAERLQRETIACGHLFFPLQVGAWTRKE